ncbi:MAG TPA: DUF1572 domain-containing protein, partial [Aequorivita sp.]|nr:DUF1572 domain-containing protein [Aequorivita sp.]
MKTSSQLAERFREVLLDGKWIANTNFKESLSNINWQQATQKTGSLNTIAALTFHVNYYIAGLCDFFENGKLEIHDKYSFDFAPINSAEAWDALRKSLFENSEKFAKFIESFSDEKLNEI